MIEPRRAAIMMGRTARATRKTPRTLTAMTRSHSSTDVSWRAPIPAIPALLNRTSIPPKRAATSRASASASSGSVTLTRKSAALPPASAIWRTVSAAAAGLMSATAT